MLGRVPQIYFYSVRSNDIFMATFGVDCSDLSAPAAAADADETFDEQIVTCPTTSTAAAAADPQFCTGF
jgi:hypothetical protein